ncbi:MAG: MnmC family methyltransferase [Candidatus Woesearchaeota archaeon]|jgi:tRNA U34 5-methylaminomethyl-2-thiouridine-forming methyltransferase MnmC
MSIQPIVTDDGSPSFRNNNYDEAYHSKSGAIEESFKKYALPLKIWEKENPVIYDVCFGIGYNAAAAIDVFLEKGKGELKIYCYENDPEILKKALEINPEFKNYELIKKFVEIFFNENKIEFKQNNICLIMRVGDARELIKIEKENADFVFFDPFSPKKHPEMWEREFLKDIYEHMNKMGILSTYSYARIVRDNLKDVGFTVSAGPVIGRRSPSTIAKKE